METGQQTCRRGSTTVQKTTQEGREGAADWHLDTLHTFLVLYQFVF